MKELFPAFLDIKARRCLVIGGGAVAERKVTLLLECQAEVVVVSPDLTESLKNLVEQGRIIYYERKFLQNDIEGVFLVVAASGDSVINDYLKEQSLIKGFLLNVVDEPEKGNFYVPAIVRRGKLKIAISTSGASPMLAAKLRKKLEKEFGPEYETFLELLANLREDVKERIDDESRRERIYRELVESDILELIKSGDEVKVKERINKCLS